MASQLQTGVGCLLDRSVTPRMAGGVAQMMESSGVVDYFCASDQLVAFWPRSLWTPENTPLAEVISDPDSFCDAAIISAIAAAATENLGTVTSADSVRRGPAELMQTMLTLAGITHGKSILQLGAGEVKQTAPWGYKRSEGLARFEDLLRIFRLLLERDEPFDYEGKIWKLHQAYIGSIRPHRPQVWGLGGGPKFMELCAKYADGFVSASPCVFPTVDRWAAVVQQCRRALEQEGRDPDDFGYGIEFMGLVNDDPDVIERAYDNPLVRWLAAIFGRFTHDDWEKEGVDRVFPPGWHYANDLIPSEISPAEADAINRRIPREMVAKSFLSGTVKEVTSVMQEYVDAGANFVTIYEFTPLLSNLAEGMTSINRVIDCHRILKAP